MPRRGTRNATPNIPLRRAALKPADFPPKMFRRAGSQAWRSPTYLVFSQKQWQRFRPQIEVLGNLLHISAEGHELAGQKALRIRREPHIRQRKWAKQEFLRGTLQITQAKNGKEATSILKGILTRLKPKIEELKT